MVNQIQVKQCCQPARDSGDGSKVSPNEATTNLEVSASLKEAAMLIPGGEALLGTNEPFIADDGEHPLHTKHVASFKAARTAVTNAEFEKFIEETKYVTEAERFSWSFVFWSDVSKDIPETRAVIGAQWWRQVEGSTWKNLNGPGTMLTAFKPDHPVVHVSWNDAMAYANWVGGRLPTEAEWEHAARGGLGDVRFPWGSAEPDDQSNLHCNIWQGRFPETNTLADGYSATAPAASFEPNGYGLYNMVGNVWEWTADTFKIRSLKRDVKKRLEQMKGYKLSKGGSFLCHKSYCYRYRIAARSGTSPDSTTTHQGFRVVWDV